MIVWLAAVARMSKTMSSVFRVIATLTLAAL